MTRPWPWDESVLARHKRIVQSYRVALEDAAPETCRRIDNQMISYGQRWVVPALVIYDPDHLLTPDLAADYACCALKTIYEWRRRGMPTITTPDGIRVRFDVLRRWVAGDRGS
jgi:hypothetical protein